MTNNGKRKFILKVAFVFLCAAIALTMYFCFSISIYRARGISASYLSDTQIVLTPWYTFSCDLRGEKLNGFYEIVKKNGGNKTYCFYNKDGNFLFEAFMRGSELVYDKIYFVKMN